MKTLRAFIWGSALGALAGLFFAPQRDTILEARLASERDDQHAAATTTATDEREVPSTRSSVEGTESAGPRVTR